MKGLLIKDFKYIKYQYHFFLLLFLIAIGISMFSKESSFIIGYLSFITSLFVLTTISYDEFNNGYAFLFTLPFSRKEYIIEKYVFGLGVGSIGWLIATIIASILEITTFHNMSILELWLSSLFVIDVLILLVSIMIPIQFKFGSEKGRIVLFAIIGCVFIVFYIINFLFNMIHIDLLTILNQISNLNFSFLIIIGLIISFICLYISYKISYQIIYHKEF